MPKTTFQRFIFTLLMVAVMVYTMICYNISLNMGGMKNQIFLLAFHELILMMPIAFLLEFFLVEKLVMYFSFRIVNPSDKPILVILIISTITVILMCPLMSMIATLLFKNPGSELVALWLETTVLNFPMALFFQIVVAGPLVRTIFRGIFKKQLA